MKNIFKVLSLLSVVVIALTACNDGATGSNGPNSSTADDTGTGSTTNTNYASAKAIALSNGATETITAGGSYSISGSASDAQLVIDTTESVKLELSGVSITNSKGAVIQVTNAKDVTITLKDNTSNVISDGGTSEYNAAIFSNDTITFEGNGSLEITGNQEHGIESDDDIIINGGTITITAVNDAMHANDNITINSGNIVVVNANEGIESKNDIVINGGNLEIIASDDALNVTTDITINNGTVYAKSTKGDAIDSNGTINIKGGTIVAAGAAQPEGGIDCDRNNFSITGGTLIATGGVNSTPTETSSTQCAVVLAGIDADTLYQLEGDDGIVLAYMSDYAYQSLVFSSPLLKKDSAYTIYTGGTATGGDNYHGLYTDATYAGSTKGETITLTAMVTQHGGSSGMGGGMMGGGTRPEGGKGERPSFDGTTPPDMEGNIPPDMEGNIPPDMQNPTSSTSGETA